MSIVAIKRIGKGQFEIAADSIWIRGWGTQAKEPDCKIWKIGDMIAGTAGKASLGGLFREYIENHKPKTSNEWGWLNFMSEFMKYVTTIDSKYTFDDNSFIVVWRKKAFTISGLTVREIKKFDAIGAGMDFALASLYLGHSAKEAVEVACELSAFCEKPIKVYKNVT